MARHLVAFTASPTMNHYTSHIIIPARLASTRLPRKLLLRETGKTLLQHTYEAASRAKRPQASASPPITRKSSTPSAPSAETWK